MVGEILGGKAGSFEGKDNGYVSFERGMTIMGATVTLAAGGLSFFATDLIINSIPGAITAAGIVNAVDDLGAVINTKGNSFAKQFTTGNTQKFVGLAKTGITIMDFGASISGLKDGIKGIDVISGLSAGNSVLTGLLPSAKQTLSDVQSLINNSESNKTTKTIEVKPDDSEIQY